MGLDRIREHQGEMSGMLKVKMGEAHLHIAAFNVSSLTARNATAKTLQVHDDTINWRRLLEEFCLGVIELTDQGAEVITLNGAVPTTADLTGPPVLPPLLSYKSATILYGEGGCGKSTVAAAVALSLETGVAVIPGMTPTPMKTLILDWEDEPWVWSNRLKALANGAEIGPGKILYQKQTRPLFRTAERLSQYVMENGVEVVVVDSMGMAMGAGNEHQSAEAGAIQLFEGLKMLGTTSLIIDHIAGTGVGSDKSTSRPYGSVYKMNLARTMFELKRDADPEAGRSEVALIHTKSNYGQKLKPQGLAMVYKSGEIRLEKATITGANLQATRSIPDRMEEVLKDGALSAPDLAKALEVEVNRVRVVVTRQPERFLRLPNKKIALATTQAEVS